MVNKPKPTFDGSAVSVAPHEDGALLFRAKNADADALAELIDRYRPLVTKLARSFFGVPESEIEDLTQEGLIALHKAILLYDPAFSTFSTFAYLCVRRSMLSFLKKYNRTAPTVSLEELAEKPGAEQEDPLLRAVDRESCQALLEVCTAHLSDYEGEVFKLHLAGHTPSEAAKLLEKSEKSVSNALSRARAKLSALFS